MIGFFISSVKLNISLVFMKKKCYLKYPKMIKRLKTETMLTIIIEKIAKISVLL